jgi:hypothetical protein
VTSPFAPLPPWSGVGAVGWDGTVGAEDLRLVSASSVPKVLRSTALETWAIKRTIEKLSTRWDEFQARAQRDGADAAVDWAAELRWEKDEGTAANAADTGTDMHTLLECWVLDAPVPADVQARCQSDPVMMQMANHLWGWVHRMRPRSVLTERVVYDPVNGIAGRLDHIVAFGGAPELGTVLLDLKSSREARTKGGARKRPYADSNALQLACYRHAPLVATFEPRLLLTQARSSTRVYLLNPAERAACDPMPETQGSYILQLNPEGCLLYPVDSGAAVHRRAIEAVGLHRWTTEEHKAAVGDPYLPSIELPTFA